MKFFVCAFCSIFFFISSIQLIPIFLNADSFAENFTNKFHLLHGGLFFLIPAVILYGFLTSMYQSKLREHQFKTYTFSWYQHTYPQAVNAYGDVQCFKCNHRRIKYQRLFNHTYQVRYYCPQCSSFLFYSPEKS